MKVTSPFLIKSLHEFIWLLSFNLRTTLPKHNNGEAMGVQPVTVIDDMNFQLPLFERMCKFLTVKLLDTYDILCGVIYSALFLKHCRLPSLDLLEVLQVKIYHRVLLRKTTGVLSSESGKKHFYSGRNSDKFILQNFVCACLNSKFYFRCLIIITFLHLVMSAGYDGLVCVCVSW